MKQFGVFCKPGPALLFFLFRFEYLISGPKSYRTLEETSPWPFMIIGVKYQLPSCLTTPTVIPKSAIQQIPPKRGFLKES